MDWVKRNLTFVIGAVVAVGLLAFSGYYLYSNSKKNSEARAQLEAEYNELKRLHNLNPHPGKGDVDNIAAAREQTEVLKESIGTVGELFKPISAIPNVPQGQDVSGEQFSAALRRTIEQLNREARNSSVLVPTNYNFSFEAESRLVKFAPGSLNPLAVQLGEVKAITGILFEAKVNELTGLRRERVSPDDLTGPATDYLNEATTTNEMAEIASYEVSFESFSAELADVLSGFANSGRGLVIKALDVVPAQSTGQGIRGGIDGELDGYPPGGIYPTQPNRAVPRPQAGPYGAYGNTERDVGAYGGYARGGGGPQIRRPTFNRPALGRDQEYEAPAPRRMTSPYATPQPAVQPVTGIPAAGSQTLIDEHRLSVTLLVNVIRLRPSQEDSL